MHVYSIDAASYKWLRERCYIGLGFRETIYDLQWQAHVTSD